MEITLILTLELFAWENASANIIIIIAVLLRCGNYSYTYLLNT